VGKDKISMILIVSVLVSIIVVYTASPLFFDVIVDEEMPAASLTIPMGNFIGIRDGIHDTVGEVFVIEAEDGSKFLRFENFKSSNGPDLYVYLATDETASDYVSLGKLKGNIGNQNYLIPPGADLSNQDTVLIWCKQFSVLFGSAKLS
jgi:Electron transfer DM13